MLRLNASTHRRRIGFLFIALLQQRTRERVYEGLTPSGDCGSAVQRGHGSLPTGVWTLSWCCLGQFWAAFQAGICFPRTAGGPHPQRPAPTNRNEHSITSSSPQISRSTQHFVQRRIGFLWRRGSGRIIGMKFLRLIQDRRIEKEVSCEIINDGCLLCSEDKPHFLSPAPGGRVSRACPKSVFGKTLSETLSETLSKSPAFQSPSTKFATKFPTKGQFLWFWDKPYLKDKWGHASIEHL